MTTPISTGRGSGRYSPSDDFMEKLARQRKGTQNSAYGWSVLLGHDPRTAEKNLEMATKLGVLYHYGGDPRARMEKVTVDCFEYRMDPEYLYPAEERVARTNCESLALEQSTTLDALRAVWRCWDAYGAPGTPGVKAPPQESNAAGTPAPFDWSALLPFVPGMIALGIGVAAAFLAPQTLTVSPPPPASQPPVSFDPFDFTTWLNSPSPSRSGTLASWDTFDPVKLVNDILARPT